MAHFRRFGIVHRTNGFVTHKSEILLNLDFIECVKEEKYSDADTRTYIMFREKGSEHIARYESDVEYQYLAMALDGYRT